MLGEAGPHTNQTTHHHQNNLTAHQQSPLSSHERGASAASGVCPGRSGANQPNHQHTRHHHHSPLTKPSPHIIHIMPPSKPQLKHLARNLRNNPTDAEHTLWQHLRNRNLDSHRFTRQYLIDNAIVDFACPKAKLAIELDGGQHEQQRTQDQLRTQRLNRAGYKVIRCWNNEITTNIEGVLQTIQQALNQTNTR